MGSIDLELKWDYIMTKSHNDMLLDIAGWLDWGGLGSTVYGLRLVFKVHGTGGSQKLLDYLGLDAISILEYCVNGLFPGWYDMRALRVNKSRQH